MRTILSIAAIILMTAGVATADPTPIPGGANQAAGVEGTFGQELFNGEIRLTPKTLRTAGVTDDLIASSGQKWLVFTANASNGTTKALDMQQFVASIVDADGDTHQAQPDKVRPMGGVYGVLPGAQWREQIFFDVPASFVPVKIVLLPNDRKHDAFRILVGPTGSASSSPSPTNGVVPSPSSSPDGSAGPPAPAFPAASATPTGSHTSRDR